MLTKTIRNALFMTLAVSATFLMSGCTHSPALPIAKIEKEFKNDFDVKTLSTAIADAAKEKEWNVVNQTSTSMSLKKTYQKSQLLTTTHERWRRVTVDNDVYVTVNMNQKSFKINLADQSEHALKTDSDRELFNEDLVKLEKAIYTKLTQAVL